jgi:hypothetical protein
MATAVVLTLLAASFGTHADLAAAPRSLPEGPLILAYATHCTSFEDDVTQHILSEAENGANVLIWFAISLGRKENSSKPYIHYGLNSTCVAMVAKTLRDRGLPTTHLISIGRCILNTCYYNVYLKAIMLQEAGMLLIPTLPGVE